MEEKSFKFKLFRRGIVKTGLDTGIGAGVFVGMGGLGKHGKWASDSDSWGVGIGAGADAFAGIRVLVQEEFVFDLDESSDLAFMLFMTTQADFFEKLNSDGITSSTTTGFSTTRVTPSMAKMILKTFEFMGVDPYDYMSLYKAEIAGEAYAGAAGSVGLRFGNAEKSKKPTYWTRGNDNKMPYDRGNWSAPQYVTQFLSLSMGLDVTADICLGVELKFPDGFSEEEVYGFRIPNKVVASGYLDAEMVKQINVPLLNPMLQWIPDIGGGIKVRMEITPNDLALNVQTNSPSITFSLPIISIYAKSGEMDFYNHLPASLATLSFSPNIQFQGSAIVLPSSLNDLFKQIEPAYVEKRIPLIQFMTNPTFARFHKHRTKITRLIKHHKGSNDYTTSWGFIGDGWLTFRFAIDDSEFFTLAQNILADLMNDHGMELNEAAHYLFDVLRGTHTPNVKPEMIEKLLSTFDLMYVTLHAEGGVGGAFAGSIGAEAKIRLRASVSIYDVYHIDFTDVFLEILSEIRDHGVFQAIIQAMEPAIEQVLDINSLPED